MKHEATKGTKPRMDQAKEANLHRNNAAEWVMIVLLYPAWMGVAAWNRVRRFVLFVTSCFNKKN